MNNYSIILSGRNQGEQVTPPKGLEASHIYKEKRVKFNPILTYPSAENDLVEKLDLTDTQFDQYLDLCIDVYTDDTSHQLLGYPNPVQGDIMEEECQLASNGIYVGDGSGYESPEGKALAKEADQWKLLFQMDSDDDLGAMWGDCGSLYFWIKEEDLKNKRFDSCWMILQCS